MKVQYSPAFIKKLKKLDVKVRKSFKVKIRIFSEDPDNLELDNHSLHDPYENLRSIGITADYRAIYEEITEQANEPVAYFVLIGTHKELYSPTVA